MDFNEELIATYREETLDSIERVRNRLDQFLESTDKIERFQDILRVIHTVKGNSGAIGFQDPRQKAHHLETEILVYKEKEDEITKETIDKIYRFFDDLEEFLDKSVEEQMQNHFENDSNKMEEKNLALQKVLEDSNSGFGFFDDDTPKKADIPVVNKPQKKAEEKQQSEKNISKNNSDFIRIPTEKVQKNFDILSEIFLARNQMRYLVEQQNDRNLSQEEFYQRWELLDNTLRKSIGELEQIAMSMRMTPVTSLLRRMEKTIRTYLDDHKDKNIRVVIIGEDVEIDKKILDSLSEPLIHLTRNAMDHGVENKEERKKLGKQEQAIIEFKAQIMGNEVLLTVRDDGRGIDANKVYELALKKGLKVEHLTTPEERINIIFLPGFSTVEKATETSGRGIGMDAVKVYVESIGGSLVTKTELGHGTSFLLRLPLGMSVIPVIIAKSHGQEFAILNSDVQELKKIRPDEIHQNGENYFYKSEQGYIPCYSIDDYLFSSHKKIDLVSNKRKKIPLCIINYHEQPIALRMEELISNAEIVLKEYPHLSPKVNYISGVSILSNGQPTFVISLCKLYEKIQERRG